MNLKSSVASFTLAMVGLLACGGCQTATTATASGASNSSQADAPATSHNQEIEAVKNGTLAGYNSTTVGRAFEGTFQNSKWTSFVSPKGQLIVQFDGTVERDVLRRNGFTGTSDRIDLYKQCLKETGREADGPEVAKCVDEKFATNTLPVTFQFAFSIDKSSFTLTHIDQKAFVEDHTFQYQGSYAGQPAIRTGGSMDATDQNRVLAFIYH